MSKTKTSGLKAESKVSETFVFGKQNYILMIIGVAVIILGFVLMYGKEDIFNFTKLTLAPVTVLIGFVIEVYAIMYKPKQ